MYYKAFNVVIQGRDEQLSSTMFEVQSIYEFLKYRKFGPILKILRHDLVEWYSGG